MLVIAAHVLGDVERWWAQIGRRLSVPLDLARLYRLLRQTAYEAEAFWSVLPDESGRRIYTSSSISVPLTLELREVESMIVVWDLRFHTSGS